jgi:hypothetical protein
MTPLTGKARDRKRDDHARKPQHREEPPQRRAVVAEGLGKVVEHPPRHVEDELQEAPGDGRRHDSHDRGKHEQGAKVAAAHRRRGIRGGRGGGISHGLARYSAGSRVVVIGLARPVARQVDDSAAIRS